MTKFRFKTWLLVSVGTAFVDVNYAFLPVVDPKGVNKAISAPHRPSSPTLAMPSGSSSSGRRHVAYNGLGFEHDALPLIAQHSNNIAADNVLDAVLSFPAFWSLSIMVTLVALLYTWESFVETVRETIPHTFLPVFEKMWAEVAGLGFIGLFLQVLVHPFEHWLGHLSEKYLGEEEILLESFEFVHTAFFQVGIAFFTAAGYQVAVSLHNMERLNNLEEIGLNGHAGTCTVTPNRLATFLDAPSIPARDVPYTDEEVLALLPRTTVWEEFQIPSEKRNAQSLLIRAYMIDEGVLPESARMMPLMEARFSNILFELVELSPLTWLPLVPALALGNAVDLSHDVVNSASPNALDAAGFFFSSPEALVPSLAIEFLSVVWGLVNFWKMSEIKSMILPTLVLKKEDSPSGSGSTAACIVSPRSKVPSQVENFSSSPPLLAAVERFFSKQGERESTEEGGKAARILALYGEGNPELYLSSLQLHTWLCITSVVFFGTQILPRDLEAFLYNRVAMAGDPANVLPEFLTYTFLVAISLALLALSPSTFLNLSICTCFVDEYENLNRSNGENIPSTAPEKDTEANAQLV
ncbi:hypothetical protein ACA910_021113 [Epithemia clementina (nom. ined.)]